MTAPPDREVQERLRALLASDEFHERVSDHVREWLDRWIPGALRWLRALPAPTRVALLVLCVLLLAAIGFHLWLTLRSAAPGGPRPARARVDREVGPEPDELSARARDLAAAGRFREAARVLHQGALLRLSRRRALPWRAELADWEWVAALPDVRGLAEFTRAAQRIAYGPESEPGAWAECEALYAGLA